MHFLVTRPLPDAWQNKAEIEKLGHQVTLAPLIDIVFEDLGADTFDGVSGVIVTSQNALRSLAFAGLADKVKPLQVYAVGEATALLAHELKLRNISAGRGTAEELVPFIVERQTGRAGKLIHLTGDHKAFDMKAALAEKGLAVDDVPAYRQVAAESLPGAVVGLIKSGAVGAVTLYSPRTAEIWAKLAAKHGFGANLATLIHFCLSDAVAARLPREEVRRIEIAAEPKNQEILALIKGLAA